MRPPLSSRAFCTQPHSLQILGSSSWSELVRPVPSSSLRSQSEYAFLHALVRDIAYGQIPRAVRSAKHRLAAAWIEGIAGERLGDLGEILAHHATSALELARAAGQT